MGAGVEVDEVDEVVHTALECGQVRAGRQAAEGRARGGTLAQ